MSQQSNSPTKTPYTGLNSRQFWRPAIADRHVLEIGELWNPEFTLSQDQPVATYGSCFAQHIGRSLAERGCTWNISEEPPKTLPSDVRARFSYDLFSSRTGNIYTPSLLHQWTQWSIHPADRPEDIAECEGRYFDLFRPTVEPDGFASISELRLSMATTLDAFRQSIASSDFFVFTLGLTERWRNQSREFEYPICPGVAAGNFNESVHVFDNLDHSSAASHLSSALTDVRSINPNISIVLTVSPVPLVATYSDDHVLVATTRSKSILRSIVEEVRASIERVYYFPSFEIISSSAFEGIFFEPNKRSVSKAGVKFVMSEFFRPFGLDPTACQGTASQPDDVCDEILLEAFDGNP